ncbi:hypothetical protein FIV31_05210, partial [Coxiella endosymbiont of Ornithodoros amblus]|nr:hypothetical protein [Coxiella endosymbiont of Ornithodoros amblus]
FSSKLIVDTTTQGLYVWSKAEYGKIMISSIAPVFRCAHRGYGVGFKVDLMRCIIISYYY